MKAAIYCRVSTQEQARHGESLADQEAALRAFAAEHGHSVVGVYRDEGFSARKSYRTRPAMQALLADIEADSVQIVLFTKLDRWFRNLSDYYKVQEILEAHRVTWQAILEDYDTISSAGRFKVNIMLSVAQHEADLTSDRLKFTLAEKRKRGEIISGTMPIGYMLTEHRPVKDPATSAGVKAFFDTYLATGSKAASIDASIAAGCPMTRNKARGILQAPEKYAGVIQETVPAEPYITMEQADQIRMVHGRRPRSKHTFLFAGLARCATCGGAYVGHKHTSKKSPSSDARAYYCSKRANTRGQGCNQKRTLSERKIEAALLERLDGALADLVLEAELSVDDEAVQAREHQRELLQDRRRRGFDAYLAGVVSLEEFTVARQSIDEQLAVLTDPPRKDPEEVRAILPDGWRAIYDDMSPAGKKAFWLSVIDTIIIMPDGGINFSFRK